MPSSTELFHPFMSDLGIIFYVVGALFTLYVVAATWRSSDSDARLRERRPGKFP
jgi:hypothetical protein